MGVATFQRALMRQRAAAEAALNKIKPAKGATHETISETTKESSTDANADEGWEEERKRMLTCQKCGHISKKQIEHKKHIKKCEEGTE